VFIRAPWIESVCDGVEVLSRHGDRIVAARQGDLLATTFHPELTGDVRIHRLFVDSIVGSRRA
jgi:5'-phosphate synthase pdxT subunit